MSVVVVGEVPDTTAELSCQFQVGISSSLVIVKQAVDALVPMQHIHCFGNIGNRIENDIILPIKIGHGRAVLHPQREEGQIVHHTLEHESLLLLFSLLAYITDVFGCDATLEKTVTHFRSSGNIGKADGEIGLAVMDEVQLLTFQPCQVDVYSPFLQITEQCRMGKFSHLQMLETRFGCLLAKRERYGTDVLSLLLDFL